MTQLRILVALTALLWTLFCPPLSADQEHESAALSQRHQPAADNYLFTYQSNNFNGYITHEQQRIADSRTDLQGLANDSAQHIILANAPFMREPAATCPKTASGKSAKGIVLSHGLSDSPYTMHALAAYFQSQCFLVYGILMPGHGTRPGDLVPTNWLQWIKAMEFGMSRMQQQADAVYLGGFSTGATLALYLAAGRDDIAGLMLFAPAIDISEAANFAWLHHLSSWAVPRTAWLNIRHDTNPYKYESFAMNAVSQINGLTDAMKRRVEDLGLTTPIFMAASWEDSTVDTPEAVAFFNQLNNSHNILLLFSQQGRQLADDINLKQTHIINSGPGAKTNTGKAIYGLPHIALPIAPNDKHYGKDSGYTECSIYFSEASAYQQCMQGKADKLGEITAENRESAIVQRLSYNPFFRHMTQKLGLFIQSTDTQK